MEKRKFENNQNTQTPNTDLADQILEHELLKEAARIEEETKDTEVPFQEGDEERLFARIMEQVEKQKEQGRTTSKIEEFTRSADEYERKRKRRFRMAARAAAAVVVLSVGIFGFAMTSEGNRLRVMEIWDKAFGSKEVVRINNGENRVYTVDGEEKARNDIFNELHAEFPHFFYVPEGMSYSDSIIEKEAGTAFVTYEYYDNNLIFYVSINENEASENKSTDNQNTIVDTVKINTKDGDVEASILETTDGKYIARWEYRNVYYEFGGEIEKSELIKIIKEILY